MTDDLRALIGTTLHHNFTGDKRKRVDCLVTEQGFIFEGVTYGTLTAAGDAAARSVGRHPSVNGFVFWNVNKCIPHRRVARKTRAVVPVPLTMNDISKLSWHEAKRAFTRSYLQRLMRAHGGDAGAAARAAKIEDADFCKMLRTFVTGETHGSSAQKRETRGG